MAVVNCLIADDEPIAREIIQNYCAHLPELKVVASCANALEAKAAMQQYKIEILFLDINMPVLDGISFLKQYNTNHRLFSPRLIKNMH